MTGSAPIGIFDSGVGGLTVARSIIDQLPGEQIRYIGDTANGPYGPLAVDEVLDHAMAVADHLVQSGVKMLVIACNTASAAGAFEAAVARYDVPVVEVIRPAVRRAIASTKTGEIGVIGTSGTIDSGAYQDAFAATTVDVVVRAQACPSFVDFVERGITSGRQVLGLAQAYLAPLQRTAVDTLVLGCTHYPLLTGVLQLVMGDDVNLVSSAEETAKDVYRLLTESDLLADPDPVERPRHEFLSTGDPVAFARLGRRFLGPEISSVTLAG